MLTEEALELLRSENQALRAELKRLQDWPDEVALTPGVYGSTAAWRNRALVDEKKIKELQIVVTRLRSRLLDAGMDTE